MQRRHYDEMRTESGEVRPHFRALSEWLAATPAERVAAWERLSPEWALPWQKSILWL